MHVDSCATVCDYILDMLHEDMEKANYGFDTDDLTLLCKLNEHWSVSGKIPKYASYFDFFNYIFSHLESLLLSMSM